MPSTIELACPTDAERERLAAFRRAAQQLLRAWWPFRELNISYNMLAENAAHSGFIPWTELRSLAMALRLIYMPSESANLLKVLAIAERVPEQWVTEFCTEAREAWKSGLRGRTLFSVEEHSYDAEGVLNVWLNAVAFHQDINKQADHARLAQFEPATSAELQMCMWRFCVCVYSVDRLLAQLLDQPQFPGLDLLDEKDPFAFGKRAI